MITLPQIYSNFLFDYVTNTKSFPILTKKEGELNHPLLFTLIRGTVSCVSLPCVIFCVYV